MDRKEFLRLTGTGLAGLTLSCYGKLTESFTANRPNILFIMSDDLATNAISAYKSRLSTVAPTPNIDRIAEEGMLFQNVFCSNSICTPSRATILTGQYSHINNVLTLKGNLPPEKQYLPSELKKAGYQTAMIGKWHLKQEPASFDYYKVLPGQGKYKDPKFRIRGEQEWKQNQVQESGHSSDLITDATINWLNTRDRSKPFFLMHHFKAPHGKWEYAERYERYLDDVEIPEPDSLYENSNHGSVATRGEDDSKIHEIGSSLGRRHNKRRQHLTVEIPDTASDDEYKHLAYQNYLKRYLRCCKGVDDNIGRLLEYLTAEDLLDDTVIIYTSDQGMFLGEHDYIDKRWMYEESLRMPFMVRYPRLVKNSKTNHDMITNADFAPTILELAGVKQTPDYMQGRSFVENLQSKTPSDWPDAVYYRYWMHMAHHYNPAHFGIRTDRYKLIFFYGTHFNTDPNAEENQIAAGQKYYDVENVTSPGWELYDLKQDPCEMSNLYNDPGYQEVVTELKNKLRKLREKVAEDDSKYPLIQDIIDKHWND